MNENDILTSLFGALNFNGDTSKKANYKEILRLESLCRHNNIECELKPLFDGYKLTIFSNGKEVTDAVEHSFSYGASGDLLETWVFGLDDVAGYLDAEECLEEIEKFLK